MLTPESLKQHEPTRDGDLPLVVLAEDEALEFRAEVLAPAGGQRGHHRLARGHQPAFTPQENRPRLHNKVLDDKLLIAFEARILWNGLPA